MHVADASSAAGHLLCHLHDPHALRANPLVAHLFAERERRGEEPSAALARVHELVLDTARQIFEGAGAGRSSLHRRRLLEIVVRCDVQGETPEALQTELGLTAQQFQSEHARARARLAEAFEALAPTHLADRNAVLDARGVSVAAIRAARTRADDALAVRLIHEQLDADPAPTLHVHLLAVLADIQAQNGEFADARQHLERASSVNAQDDASRARLLQCEAQLAASEGRHAACARACDAALGLYERVLAPHDAFCDEQVVATLHLACAAKRQTGAFEEALAALRAARELVERRSDLPLYLAVRTLELLGVCQLAMPGARALAEAHLLEARAIARRNGLVREAVTCTLHLAGAGLDADQDRTLAIGRDALNVARKVLGRATYAWLCLAFCARELRAGCRDNVVRLARTARACNDSAICVSMANMLEAEALLLLGDAEQAHVLAISAIDTFRKAESSRYLGTTLRIASEAAFRLGRSEYARYAINEALTLLEQYGHPLVE